MIKLRSVDCNRKNRKDFLERDNIYRTRIREFAVPEIRAA